MSHAAGYSNRVVATARGAYQAHRSYSIAIVDDCFDDYTLLAYLLSRSNIQLKSIKHYASLSELSGAQQNIHDIVFLDQCEPSCARSYTELLDMCARHAHCGVFLHTPADLTLANYRAKTESSVAVFKRGSLDTDTLEAVVSAAALVGRRVKIH